MTNQAVDDQKLKTIFISHIHEEGTIAQAIKNELEKCFPAKVHVYLSEIVPFGDDWQKSVNTNLKEANLILILFSPDSIERPWINIEAGYGIISGKKVIPLFCLGLNQDRLHYMYQRLKGIDVEKPSDVKRLLEENIKKDLLEDNTQLNLDEGVKSLLTTVTTAVTSYANQRVINFKIQSQAYFHIFNEFSNRCLDVFSWRKTANAPIIAYSLHGGNNQLWQLQRLDDIYFRITSRHSKMCLEANDQNIFQNKFDGNEKQQWDVTQISNENYKISCRQYPDKCLSIEQDKNDPQVSQVVIQPWRHQWHQIWTFKITATVTPV